MSSLGFANDRLKDVLVVDQDVFCLSADHKLSLVSFAAAVPTTITGEVNKLTVVKMKDLAADA